MGKFYGFSRRGIMTINHLEKVEVISQTDYLETYKPVKYQRNYSRVSVWNDNNFKRAIKLAKENPNSWILFNKFQCTEGMYVRKNHERNAIKYWFTTYKKRNMLDNYYLEVRQKDGFELAYLSYQDLEQE